MITHEPNILALFAQILIKNQRARIDVFPEIVLLKGYVLLSN